MQPEDFKKIKKLEKQLIAAIFLFIITIAVGVWVIFGLVAKQSVFAGDYSNNSKTELTLADWNGLDDDFVDASGDIMTGPLIVEKAGILAATDKNWIMDISQRMDGGSTGGLLGVRIGFGGDGVYDGRLHTDRSVGVAAVAEDTWGNDVGMALYTGGSGLGEWSEKVRITSDGKVGIGTNNPEAKLDVVGDIAINGRSYIKIGATGPHSAGDTWEKAGKDILDLKLVVGSANNAKKCITFLISVAPEHGRASEGGHLAGCRVDDNGFIDGYINQDATGQSDGTINCGYMCAATATANIQY